MTRSAVSSSSQVLAGGQKTSAQQVESGHLESGQNRTFLFSSTVSPTYTRRVLSKVEMSWH